MSGTVEILENPDVLAHRVAQWMCEKVLAREGAFAIALSGGSTPRTTYEILGGPLYRERLPWARLHWFWSDERFVPHDDPKSNCRMAREALLSRAPVPPGNIHPIPTDAATPDMAADAYARALASFYGGGELDPARPLFDILLLGLGTDGHTASLFPGSGLLNEAARWAAADLRSMPEPRITLTYPALESSRHTAFLVAGSDKRDIFHAVRNGTADVPAARLRPQGELIWFADRAASDGA